MVVPLLQTKEVGVALVGVGQEDQEGRATVMAGGMTCSKGRIVVILGAMEGEEEDTSREEEEEVEEEVRGWTLPVKALLFPASSLP